MNSFVTDALRGKTCLVTGGSRTLGAVIVQRLAQHGATVIVNYQRARAEAEALCAAIRDAGGQAHALQADISDPQQIEQLVVRSTELVGSLDLLVHNVGPYVDKPFLDLTLDEFDLVMNANVRSSFLLSQQVGRQMKARGSGQIINIAATDAFHRSHSVYGLAKSALIHLTEALALELAPNVRINAIAPDLIAENEDMDSDFASSAVAATPAGRLVSRHEIADLVCLLCTPTFAMASGRTFVLDGGRSIPRIHG